MKHKVHSLSEMGSGFAATKGPRGMMQRLDARLAYATTAPALTVSAPARQMRLGQ